jgi:predicted nucleotidyltransferase
MLSQDFREFIELLNSNEVRYLVVGGYAVAFHGYPRYTKDLDVWIYADPENVEKLIRALKQFGFGSLGLTPDDFLTPDQVIQLGYPPNRIDLLTSFKGVDFKNAYESRVQTEIDGLLADFVDLENLKKNKASTGRPQDIADLENLKP